MSGAHHSIDLLYTALGWLSNIALLTYAPFAKTWRRALLVQLLLVCGWAAVRFIAVSRFGGSADPASLYLTVVLQTLAFAAVVRTLKLLLFKLPALRALEQHLRPERGQNTP